MNKGITEESKRREETYTCLDTPVSQIAFGPRVVQNGRCLGMRRVCPYERLYLVDERSYSPKKILSRILQLVTYSVVVRVTIFTSFLKFTRSRMEKLSVTYIFITISVTGFHYDNQVYFLLDLHSKWKVSSGIFTVSTTDSTLYWYLIQGLSKMTSLNGRDY